LGIWDRWQGQQGIRGLLHAPQSDRRRSSEYELHPIKAVRREIEARVWSLVHDHPILKASLSRASGAYEVATFEKLEGQPNWTMEWITDDRHAKAAFERVVRSVQSQIELE